MPGDAVTLRRVADVTDMQVSIEAARALLYETARICDLEPTWSVVMVGPVALDLRAAQAGRMGRQDAEAARALDVQFRHTADQCSGGLLGR